TTPLVTLYSYPSRRSSDLALPEALWIDARAEEDFARGSLPGAVSLSLESWEEGLARLLERWTPERPIVVFCSSQSCLRSHEAARSEEHTSELQSRDKLVCR